MDSRAKERSKYLIRRIEKGIKLSKNEFSRLTRCLFDNKLPKICKNCGELEDLQIHHINYDYPIKKKYLVRLCRRCHVLEHQRLHPKFQ